jgi:DEAD/DEAH box helicase domain-containing protein
MPTRQQLLALRPLPSREGDYRDIPAWLHPDLRSALEAKGITRLYSHQRESLDLAQARTDFVVTTPTASGKTLCFNLPVVHAALQDPSVRALYLYPTKALANDQLAVLHDLMRAHPGRVSAVVFTGDTPQDEREQTKSRLPNILIGNPDILHYQQLADHMAWERWWAQLRFVVIDEAHVYRGVFGSHVAHVLRRLRRIAAHYGAEPQFIAASATIANPVELIERLTSRAVVHVSHDGSPRARRQIIAWHPAVSAVTPTGPIYESVDKTTVGLVVAGMLAGRSVIAFARSRRQVERLRRDIDAELRRTAHGDMIPQVVSYRAGYDAERRRDIERSLRNGSTRAVVATVALELGVDIGSLDMAVLAGYPGSVMGFWQQAGRAGRRDRPALVVMVTSQNPLDQFLAANPDRLIGAPVEHAVLNPANSGVAVGQLTCAARELSIRANEAQAYGDDVFANVAIAETSGALIADRRGWHAAPGHGHPDEVSLRSIDDHPYALLVGPSAIGVIESRYIPKEAHVGAVYLHDGEAFRVMDIDDLARTVQLRYSDEGLLTDPFGSRDVRVTDIMEEKQLGLFDVALVRLASKDTIDSYVHVNEFTKRRVGGVVLLAQPRSMALDTIGLRITAAQSIGGPALHAVEHLVRALGTINILCDPADLEGHTDLDGGPVAFVFDRNPGGIGLAELLFDRLDAVLAAAAERVLACDCREGCPACIQSGSCLRRNDALDKGGAALALSG